MIHILFILATWRFASLLTNEEGPYTLLEKLRSLVGVLWTSHDSRVGTNEFAKGLLCLWCSSLWWGMLFATFAALTSNLSGWLIPVAGLAYSTGAILIDELITYWSQPR